MSLGILLLTESLPYFADEHDVAQHPTPLQLHVKVSGLQADATMQPCMFYVLVPRIAHSALCTQCESYRREQALSDLSVADSPDCSNNSVLVRWHFQRGVEVISPG